MSTASPDRHLTATLLALAAVLPVAADAPATPRPLAAVDARLAAAIDEHLAALRDELIAFRRDIHTHPELSGQEVRTAGVVAAALEELELEVERGVGGHGVVAVLRGALPGRVVAFRADMDAVASDAPDPVAFASQTPGVRHICGHDVHTTIGVGLAHALSRVRDSLRGTVKLIFQPAEETVAGARAMIAAGAMESPTPGAIFAVHTSPLGVGQIGGTAGQALPARDIVRVTLSGSGDLERAAEEVTAMLADLTEGLPDDFAANPGRLVTTDFILAQVFGTRPGDAGGELTVTGQITTVSEDGRARAQSRLRRALDGLGAGAVEHELEVQERFAAGIYNDPDLFEACRDPIASVIGEESFVVTRGTLPIFSEDFGFFQDEAPGVMFWLGVSNPAKGTVGMPHAPDYVADEESILVGTRVMAAVLLSYLGAPARTD